MGLVGQAISQFMNEVYHLKKVCELSDEAVTPAVGLTPHGHQIEVRMFDSRKSDSRDHLVLQGGQTVKFCHCILEVTSPVNESFDEPS